MDRAEKMRVGEVFSQDKVFYYLILLFPLGIGSILHYTSSLFLIMTLAGSYYSFKKRNRLPASYKRIIVSLLIFSCAILLSLVNSHDFAKALTFSSKTLYVLALFPLLLSAQGLTISLLRPFFIGLMLAGPLNLLIALNSRFISGAMRAHGSYGPPLFGDMMMLCALILMAFMMSGFTQKRKENIIALISVVCFLSASTLSGTRAAILAFIIVFPVLFFLCRLHLNKKMKLIASASGIVIISLVFLSSSYSLLSGRYPSTLKNIQSYSQGTNLNTSFGQRMMMWDVSVEMFLNDPILGSGYGDFRHDLQNRIDDGSVAMNRTYRHAHNIFFDTLGSTGLLGLISMVIALFIVPLQYFRAIKSASVTCTVSKVAGIVVLLSYAVFGLTEGWLAISPLLIPYIVIIFIFMSESAQNASEISREDRFTQ